MSKPSVFVCFDVENDEELYQALLEQSRNASAGFSVLGGSESSTPTDACSDRVRLQIREAGQVIVICGEHTEASTRMSAELRVAEEEKTPYFMIWGRRGTMCTKPSGAKPAAGMYSWTRQILEDQIALTLSKARADAMAAIRRDATRKA